MVARWVSKLYEESSRACWAGASRTVVHLAETSCSAGVVRSGQGVEGVLPTGLAIAQRPGGSAATG